MKCKSAKVVPGVNSGVYIYYVEFDYIIIVAMNDKAPGSVSVPRSPGMKLYTKYSSIVPQDASGIGCRAEYWELTNRPGGDYDPTTGFIKRNPDSSKRYSKASDNKPWQEPNVWSEDFNIHSTDGVSHGVRLAHTMAQLPCPSTAILDWSDEPWAYLNDFSNEAILFTVLRLLSGCGGNAGTEEVRTSIVANPWGIDTYPAVGQTISSHDKRADWPEHSTPGFPKSPSDPPSRWTPPNLTQNDWSSGSRFGK